MFILETLVTIFVFLMGLCDDDLPGRHDKLIWAFLLFVFAPIAIWLFRSYRPAYWPEPAVESDSSVPSGATGYSTGRRMTAFIPALRLRENLRTGTPREFFGSSRRPHW